MRFTLCFSSLFTEEADGDKHVSRGVAAKIQIVRASCSMGLLKKLKRASSTESTPEFKLTVNSSFYCGTPIWNWSLYQRQQKHTPTGLLFWSYERRAVGNAPTKDQAVKEGYEEATRVVDRRHLEAKTTETLFFDIE